MFAGFLQIVEIYSDNIRIIIRFTTKFVIETLIFLQRRYYYYGKLI